MWNPPEFPLMLALRAGLPTMAGFDPQLRAVRAANPDFRFGGVHVITTVHLLHNLLLNCHKGRLHAKIYMSMINNTLIFETRVPTVSMPKPRKRVALPGGLL